MQDVDAVSREVVGGIKEIDAATREIINSIIHLADLSHKSNVQIDRLNNEIKRFHV